jgi:pyruvate dehydrogenase E1 component alpha subunit
LGLTFVFFGDGATEEGVFFESLNFAALWKLPVVFVCENNKYSVYTPLTSRQPISRDVTKLADSLGIVSIKVSDRNVAFALKKIAIELQKSRVIPQPLLIEIDTYRFLEHCGPNDDDHLGYRPKSEIENFKDHDPLMSLIAELIRASHLAVEDLEALEIVFSTEITEAFHFAEQSPFPTIESVLEIP